MSVLASLRVHAFSVPNNNDYNKLKTRLKKSTFGYGSAISLSYFITQGAEKGVSSTVGAMASYVYMDLLSQHVDSIEKSSVQKQIFVPISTAIFETMWNNAPFAFDFDYGSTFVGFLAYKFALISVLYDTVKEMMLEDASRIYTKLPVKSDNDDDADEQHGEINVHA